MLREVEAIEKMEVEIKDREIRIMKKRKLKEVNEQNGKRGIGIRQNSSLN